MLMYRLRSKHCIFIGHPASWSYSLKGWKLFCNQFLSMILLGNRFKSFQRLNSILLECSMPLLRERKPYYCGSELLSAFRILCLLVYLRFACI